MMQVEYEALQLGNSYRFWYFPDSGGGNNGNNAGGVGLFPSVFNLATRATITANATCGSTGPEVYCKLVEHVQMRAPQCGVCDGNSPDYDKRHPITNAIDGTPRWWQSPSLQNGPQYEWVTITLDLKQVQSSFLSSWVFSVFPTACPQIASNKWQYHFQPGLSS
jgi:hypothetical protein